ncbi:MAG: tetratricopeptide repeat protein [Lentisphaeria bacterium]|nr:tetratricopeptide repeat protein [Lentisphaeria bacterium]NQZ69531.1 tetratricopeptide repeat protein [Lentisphaeria bacterium]
MRYLNRIFSIVWIMTISCLSINVSAKDTTGDDVFAKVKKVHIRSCDRSYEKSVPKIYLGQRLYFEVLDLEKSSKPRTNITITLKTSSNQTAIVKLWVTERIGLFHGTIKTVVLLNGKAPKRSLGLAYGDTVTIQYSYGGNTSQYEIKVHPGANGTVEAFNKRYINFEMAVSTKCMVVESYIELAKKYRLLKRNDLTRSRISSSRKLLEKTIRDYPNNKYNLWTDYLEASLMLEQANDAVDKKEKERFYEKAYARFDQIVKTDPDSDFAPRAQYKKALIFEKREQINEALLCYARLSYHYPNHELLAESFARLGQLFWMHAKRFRKKSLNPKVDEFKAAQYEKIAKEGYMMSAKFFEYHAKRFPKHQLAGKTSVLSGQAYMQAEMFDEAIATFIEAIKKNAGNDKLVSEAMYWLGDSYLKNDDETKAWRILKKLTWEYPSNKWLRPMYIR